MATLILILRLLNFNGILRFLFFYLLLACGFARKNNNPSRFRFVTVRAFKCRHVCLSVRCFDFGDVTPSWADSVTSVVFCFV